MKRIGVLVTLVGLMAGFLVFAHHPAEAWEPKVQLECIAPSNPGGGWDAICRTTAGVLQKTGITKGENIWGASPQGYLQLDLPAAGAARPDVVLFFSEPEFPIDHDRLLAVHGWGALPGFRPVVSTVARGRNLIHDGPSYAETARGLAGELSGGAGHDL